MKKWLKSLDSQTLQKIVFFSVLGLLLIGFVISLSFLPNEEVTEPLNQEELNKPEETGTPQVIIPPKEKFISPIKQTYEVLAGFYDVSKDSAELSSSMLVIDDTFISSNGLLLSVKDDSQFDVVSTLKGKVESIKSSSLYGKTVTISHDNGYTSEYSLLSDVKVKVGDNLKQGDVIGTSGQSSLSENKNNVYFIIRQNSKLIDPMELFGKSVN